MNDIITIQTDNDLNSLYHEGRKGQRKGVHQFGRWQRDTVYAQGRPDPNAKSDDTRDSSNLNQRAQKPMDKLNNKLSSLVKPKMVETAKGALNAAMKSAMNSNAETKMNAQLKKLKEKQLKEQIKQEKRALKDQKSKEKKAADNRSDPTAQMTTDELKRATDRLIAENNYMTALANRNEAQRKYREALDRPARETRQKLFNMARDFTRSNAGIALENAAMLAVQRSVAKSYDKDTAERLFRGTRIGNKQKKGGGN